MWLWRPLHKYYVKICRNVNPQTTLIDAFAMSLVFSYSRLLFISSALLHPTQLVTPEGKGEKLAPYFDGSIDYFSPQHLPYVLLSICVIIVFNILPIVFLCVYPPHFRNCLETHALKSLKEYFVPLQMPFKAAIGMAQTASVTAAILLDFTYSCALSRV